MHLAKAFGRIFGKKLLHYADRLRLVIHTLLLKDRYLYRLVKILTKRICIATADRSGDVRQIGVEYIHQEAKKRHLLIRAVPFCMNEPVNEMQKTLLRESKDDQAFVFIVFTNLESYRKLINELEMKYKNVNISGKFIDVGSGYFVRLARVATKG